MKSARSADEERSKVVRDGLAIGIATGAYGLSFGALSIAAGLSLVQTAALSLFMFTGASQFAFVAVVEAGGSPLSGAATACLLGSRNALYGLHLSSLLKLKGPRKALAAQFVIDESSAMSLGRRTTALARVGFWTSGLSVFVLWNLATLGGALGAQALSDPQVLGLDAVAPAAFLALLAPRMRTLDVWMVAAIAALLALAAVPLLPAGLPVLVAAGLATLAGLTMSPSPDTTIDDFPARPGDEA
jgi:predicted branched-subunit amino acid permease